MKTDFFRIDYLPTEAINQDDVNFFYFDVGIDNISGFPSIYIWDKVVNDFKEKFTISTYSKDENLGNYEDNIIKFVVADNENECESFYRHLRNAFCHYHIARQLDYFLIRDINSTTKKVRMIGKVKADDLKQFCFAFFNQREAILAKLENLNNQIL